MRPLNLHAKGKYTNAVYVEREICGVIFTAVRFTTRHTLGISSCRRYTQPHLSPLTSQNESDFV